MTFKRWNLSNGKWSIMKLSHYTDAKGPQATRHGKHKQADQDLTLPTNPVPPVTRTFLRAKKSAIRGSALA